MSALRSGTSQSSAEPNPFFSGGYRGAPPHSSPYRSWCEFCNLGRGIGDQHRRSPGKQRSIAIVGLDYWYITSGVMKRRSELEQPAGAEGERLVPGGVAAVWSCLDGLMHVGNIQFTPSEEEEAGEDGLSRPALARRRGLAAVI